MKENATLATAETAAKYGYMMRNDRGVFGFSRCWKIIRRYYGMVSLKGDSS